MPGSWEDLLTSETCRILLPVVHPFVGGTTGSIHTSEFSVVDYEAAVVFPAKLMALCVIDLLSEGAIEAKLVKSEFQPLLTKEKYLDRWKFKEKV